MLILVAATGVNDAFFQPLDGLIAGSPPTDSCPEYSDQDCLLLGFQRVLAWAESGWAFLQEHGPRFDYQPTRVIYFAALQSERRLDLVRGVALGEQVDFSRSLRIKGSGAAIVARCRGIYDVAKDNLPALGEHGVTQAKLTAFNQAIKTYDTMRSTPRQAKAA